MIKITVVVLTYNHEKFIKKALDSILEQETKYNFNILVGDDCSPDSTSKILEEYKSKNPEKFNLILRKKNIGARENFLDLLSKADGEYIALLEGDDYWDDKIKLEKMISFLEENLEYIGGFHNIRAIDAFDNYHKMNNEFSFSDIDSLSEHYEKKQMATLSMVFRNVFLQNENLQNYKKMLKDVKYVCDYSLKAFLLSKGKFKYFQNIFGIYRCIENSGTSWSAQAKIVKDYDLLIVYEGNIELFPEKAKEKLALEYFKVFLKVIFYYSKNKDSSKIFKLIKRFKYNILFEKSIYQLIFKRIKNGK